MRYWHDLWGDYIEINRCSTHKWIVMSILHGQPTTTKTHSVYSWSRLWFHRMQQFFVWCFHNKSAIVTGCQHFFDEYFSVTVKIWKIITMLRQLLVKSQSKHHFMLWVHAIIQNWIVQHTNIFFDNKDGIAGLNRTLRGLILHIENCEKENYGQHLVGSSFFSSIFPQNWINIISCRIFNAFWRIWCHFKNR